MRWHLRHRGWVETGLVAVMLPGRLRMMGRIVVWMLAWRVGRPMPVVPIDMVGFAHTTVPTVTVVHPRIAAKVVVSGFVESPRVTTTREVDVVVAVSVAITRLAMVWRQTASMQLVVLDLA